jgi:hypothetical protein
MHSEGKQYRGSIVCNILEQSSKLSSSFVFFHRCSKTSATQWPPFPPSPHPPLIPYDAPLLSRTYESPPKPLPSWKSHHPGCRAGLMRQTCPNQPPLSNPSPLFSKLDQLEGCSHAPLDYPHGYDLPIGHSFSETRTTQATVWVSCDMLVPISTPSPLFLPPMEGRDILRSFLWPSCSSYVFSPSFEFINTQNAPTRPQHNLRCRIIPETLPHAPLFSTLNPFQTLFIQPARFASQLWPLSNTSAIPSAPSAPS